MSSTLKPPPILPRTLRLFLVAGIVFSVAVTAVVAVAEPYIPNSWLYGDAPRGALAVETLRVSLGLSLGLSALWAAAYVSCLPYLYYGYFQDRRNARERLREAAAASELASEQAAKAAADAARSAFHSEIATRRRQVAQAALRERLTAAEQRVLGAYARHAVTTDFMGTASEADRLKTFAADPGGMKNADLGILAHSSDPTIRQLLAQGPKVRPTPLQSLMPAPSQFAFCEPPDGPVYNPFAKLNYPLPTKPLRQRFRDKLRSMRQ